VGYLFAFERLDVWQLARKFVKYTYSLIDNFPSKERYNLVDQIKRAATSIALNLAEMTSRSSYKEQAHYSEIAYGSVIEVYCAFILSYDMEYINEQQMKEVTEQIGELSNKINALKNSQYRRAEEFVKR
jgi:four helix bundle protein